MNTDAPPLTPPAPEQHPGVVSPGLLPNGMLDPVFRSGSLTAISVVLGFSLSFLNRWGSSPGDWQAGDLAAVALIVLGTAAQLKALTDMLRLRSLVPAYYERTMRIFLVGLALVLAGILVALVEDMIGFGQRILG